MRPQTWRRCEPGVDPIGPTVFHRLSSPRRGGGWSAGSAHLPAVFEFPTSRYLSCQSTLLGIPPRTVTFVLWIMCWPAGDSLCRHRRVLRSQTMKFAHMADHILAAVALSRSHSAPIPSVYSAQKQVSSAVNGTIMVRGEHMKRFLTMDGRSGCHTGCSGYCCS